jgi:integrase
MVRLTQQEAECIIGVLNRLDTKVSHLAQLCFCLCYCSGLRRGEIAGLQFADFNSLGDQWGMLLKVN